MKDPFGDAWFEAAPLELAAEDQFKRNYHQKLMRHLDCRDPDHPGCERCIEKEQEHGDVRLLQQAC